MKGVIDWEVKKSKTCALVAVFWMKIWKMNFLVDYDMSTGLYSLQTELGQ